MENDKKTTVRHFESRIFGSIRDATDEENTIITALVKECPAALFSSINRALNEKGLCISISESEIRH